MSGGVIIGLVGVVVVIAWMIGIYNRLVTLRQRHHNAFSQIDVQMKRRYDLIPNLVETVKGYMKHERETLEAVIASRNLAVNAMRAVNQNPSDPDLMKKLVGAENSLGASMVRIHALSEAYPELKADANMLSLQEELTSTENRVSFARQGYNDSVTAYNTYRETFPPIILAGMLGFREAVLFIVEEAAKTTPQIKFI